MTRLDSLQVCRAVAALLVVLCHFSIESNIFLGHEFLNSFFNFGHAGVSFFFVLSGFIICYTHWEDINGGSTRLHQYAYKRLTRILPSYWFILIITTLTYLLYHDNSSLHDVITPLIFAKNLLLVSYDHEPIVSVAWTLQYEMIFYALFMIFIVNKQLGQITFGCWLLTSILFNLQIIPHSNPSLKFLLDFCSLQFLQGCLVAYIIKKWPTYVIYPRFCIVLGIISFIVWGVHEDYYNNIGPITNAMIFASASASIILGLVKIEMMKPIKYPSTLIFLGGASYSIYLTHNIVLSLLFRIANEFPLANFPVLRYSLVTIFILLITVGTACLYYKFFEEPTLHLLRRKNIRLALRYS